MQIPVLVGMLTTLLHSDLVTASEFSQKYELSVRSVYRYIDILNEAGVPIVSKLGKNGGFKIVDEYKLKAIYFDKAEYERLLFCVNSFNLQDSVTKSLSDKLLGLKRAVANAYVLGTKQLIADTPVGVELQEKIDNFSNAVVLGRYVEIEYSAVDGKITRRVIEPYSLVISGGLWYAYCFCRLRNEFRFFKISRVLKMAVLTQCFSPRPFEVDSGKIKNEILKNKEFVEIVLRVSSESFSVIEEWLGIGCIEKDGESFLVRSKVPYDELLISKVLSLGKYAAVLSPERLKNEVVERCEEIILRNKAHAPVGN